MVLQRVCVEAFQVKARLSQVKPEFMAPMMKAKKIPISGKRKKIIQNYDHY